MGYMRHHAMIVTAYREERATAAHQEALRIFSEPSPFGEAAFIGADFARLVSPLVLSAINGYYSLAIFPDGSKEGWGTSNEGEKRRTVFKEWLRSQAFEDGSSPYAWVEVQYGDDAGETCIVDDSEAERRATP